MLNKEDRGRQASVDGFAHEHIVVGILMKKYQNVSLVDLPLSPSDVIIVFKDHDGSENIIRAQVKTAKKSVSFIGGSRGGVDRAYKSGIKEYIQSSTYSDVIIGIHPTGSDSFELYFIPTIVVERLNQKSISLHKIEKLKNNYHILENCKNQKFIIEECIKFDILSKD